MFGNDMLGKEMKAAIEKVNQLMLGECRKILEERRGDGTLSEKQIKAFFMKCRRSEQLKESIETLVEAAMTDAHIHKGVILGFFFGGVQSEGMRST